MTLPRRYDYDEAAAELRIEKRWLQRNISRLPHIKLGREVFFTDADLEQILALHRVEPTSQQAAATPTAPGGRALSTLRPLPSRRRANA